MNVLYFSLRVSILMLVMYAICVIATTVISLAAVVFLWHTHNIIAVVILLAFLIVAARFLFRIWSVNRGNTPKCR